MSFEEPIIGKPILTEVGSRAFNAEFRRSTEAQQFVLDDGRPAIMAEPLFGVPHAVTMYMHVWEIRKSQYLAKHLPAGSHERGCPTCGCKMEVTRELESTWSFRCPVCKTVDAWGKQIVGGTHGAGQKEKA